ncbi:MAG: hypothetical protein IID39_06335 [Planctomycetes bacterium]|nr:hypothetical protein [Planctomycetota bacterium]
MRSMKMRAGLLGVVLGVAAIVALSFAVAVSRAGGGLGGNLIIAVAVDADSFVGPEFGDQGPFYIQRDTGSGAGTFQCWGWIFEDGLTANVSQVYNIAGRGAVMTQGREGDFLAVVGGTGDFRNARGQAIQVFTNDFEFTLEVELLGAGQ